MKIYTKNGDLGETGLFGNFRVPKDDLRIRTYGTVDELNATLGMALTTSEVRDPLLGRLCRIQGELFQLGSELATPRGRKVPTALIVQAHIDALESEIDEMDRSLPQLQNFILPGGGALAACLHFSRTVCRRVEREVVSLHRQDPCRKEVLAYMNRLSDYLFVAARSANHQAGEKDHPWLAPASF